MHLNSDEDTLRRDGSFIYYNFFLRRQDCGTKQDEVSQALMEAWAWLVGAGFLVEKPNASGGNIFFVSRRGKQIATRADFG